MIKISLICNTRIFRNLKYGCIAHSLRIESIEVEVEVEVEIEVEIEMENFANLTLCQA